MTKAEAYYALVEHFHEYRYGCHWNDFITNIVASFQRHGYEPEDCMTIMHEVLLNACKTPCPRPKVRHLREGVTHD